MEDAFGLLKLTAARLAVDEQPSEELPALAADALALGVDSPALREAAGISTGDVRDARDAFVSALGELGIDVPDRVEATWVLVRRVATQIVDSEIPPYKGARRIWRYRDQIEWDAREGDLRIFVGLASEWEDNPSYRFAYEARIREEAASLLRRNELRPWGRTGPLCERRRWFFMKRP